jgi:hypothetical protein
VEAGVDTTGMAVTVAVEAGKRVEATGLEIAAEDVQPAD